MERYRLVLEQPVQWRDLDAMGHVNNAVYANYLENARVAYLDALTGLIGLAPPGPEDSTLPLSIILAEHTISYRSPAFLRETLLIGSRVTEMGNSSFVMESQIADKKTGRLVATSRAILVHYDYQQSRATPLPAQWRKAISQFEGQDF